MPYRLSALAERDLEEIWSYVAEDASPATADRLIDVIIDRFELLAEQPGWVACGRSLGRAFGHSPSRITSSTIDTTRTS